MIEKLRNKIEKRSKLILILVLIASMIVAVAQAQTGISNSGSSPESSLVAEYRFDTGAGDTAYDSAGNNDGTLNNIDFTASSGWTGSPSESLEGEYPNFEDWSDSRTYVCDGTEMMGGYDNFGQNTLTQKTLNLPKGEYRVKFNYYFGDSWDGESGNLFWDGSQVWSKSNTNNGEYDAGNVCGGGYSDAINTPRFASSKVTHSGGEVTLQFNSTLDQGSQDEWWGVNNIVVERIGGKQGSALNFEADGSSVSIPYSDSLDNAFSGQKFTMSAWIYPETGSSWADYVSADNPAGETHRIEQGGGGADSIYVTLADTSGSRPGVVSKDGVLNTEAWNHVMYNYDGDEMKLFVNGELEGTDQASFTIGGLTGSVDINRGDQNMKMDNLRIYDAVLNASEAKSLTAEGAFRVGEEASDIDSEIIDMSFQHVQNGQALDLSGNNNHASIENGASQAGAAGCKLGRCFSFDGSDDRLTTAAPKPSKLTFGGWFKINGDNGDSWQSVLSSRGSGEGYWIFVNEESEPRAISYNIGFEDGTRIHSNLRFGNEIEEDKWYYAAMTWDGTDAKAYLNGRLLGETSDFAGKTIDHEDTLTIGSDQNQYNLNGKIDQFKIFNRSLSQKEIWKQYTQGQDRFSNGMAGPIAHYPMKTESSPLVDAAGGNDGSLDAIGEAGTFNTSDGNWQTVHFKKEYTDPVIVGTTNTHNGQSAIYFETRNVQSNKAQMRLCESEGGDNDGCDTHGTERAGYIIVDQSSVDQVSGIKAGKFNTDSNTVSFSNGFTNTPVVFTQVMTDNSAGEVVSWVTSKDSQSFSAKICNQNSNDGCATPNEEIGWIAVEPGNEPFSQTLEAKQLANEVGSSNWASTTFDSTFSESPVGVFSVQNNDGNQDPKVDEIRNVDSTGMEMRFCELETGDNCDGHVDMAYAYLAVEKGLFTTKNSDSPYYIDSQRGKALEFDGNNDYVDTNYKHTSGTGTINYWLNTDSLDEQLTGHGTGNDGRFYLGVDNGEDIQGGFGDSFSKFTFDEIAGNEELTMVTLTGNGNTANLYANAEKLGSFNYNWNNPDGTFRIGDIDSDSRKHDGVIKNVQVYPYALSQDQISQVMNGGSVNIG